MGTVSESVGQVQDSINNAGKNVPRHATGTQFHPGGPAIITEYAAEQLTLPSGAQMVVMPRGTRVENQTQLNNRGAARASATYQITVNVDHLNDVQELLGIAQRARLSHRQGYVGT